MTIANVETNCEVLVRISPASTSFVLVSLYVNQFGADGTGDLQSMARVSVE